MIKVGVLGFGKSFLAWNLAGMIADSVIYADGRAPYRVWNRSERVVETWRQVEELSPSVVLMDHAESEVLPDCVLYVVPPDLVRVKQALRDLKEHRCPVHFVLNGYERHGVPWLFPDEFEPVAVIPWDLRQSQAILTNTPLSKLDPYFQRFLQPIAEVIANVASVGPGSRTK